MIMKLPVGNLMVGMHVVDSGLSWLEHPYVYSTEGRLSSQKQIEQITADGFTVAFIDSRLSGMDVAGASPEEAEGPPPKKPAPTEKAVAIEKEIEEAKVIYDDSLKFAREFISNAYKDKDVDMERSEEFVTDVIDSVVRNRDALVGISKLRQYDEYTYTHSINVTILATAFGEHLGLPKAELRLLGLAALFHDLGKANIPEGILNKPARLTSEEFEVMKRHPLESYEILKIKKDLPSKVILGVVEHHEKYNGAGYPRGISGNQISLFARIIAPSDVYDALTSERVYKPGMPPNKALAVMYSMREKDFYPTIVERFIKSIGVYPVGALVRLSSGHHGVVHGSNPDTPLHPSVKVAFDQNLRPVTERLVDMADPEQAGLPADVKIVECIDAEKAGVDRLALLT